MDFVEDQDKHSQLPDIEVYKASVGHRTPSRTGNSFVRTNSNRDPAEHRLDPDGVIFYTGSSRHDYRADPISVVSESPTEGDSHDTTLEHVPSQTLLKKQHVSESGFWKVCAIFALVSIAAIMLVVFLSPEDEALDFYHWVHGDTESYFAVRDYVTNVVELSEPKVFQNASSPQYLAAQWIAHGDELNLSIPKASDLTFEQRYAMTVLYFSLGGPSWSNQLSFLTGAHICTWFQEFQLVHGVEEVEGNNVLYGVHGCKRDDSGDLYPHAIAIRK